MGKRLHGSSFVCSNCEHPFIVRKDCLSLFIMLSEHSTPCEATWKCQAYDNTDMSMRLTLDRFLSDCIIVIFLRNQKYKKFSLKEAIIILDKDKVFMHVLSTQMPLLNFRSLLNFTFSVDMELPIVPLANDRDLVNFKNICFPSSTFWIFSFIGHLLQIDSCLVCGISLIPCKIKSVWFRMITGWFNSHSSLLLWFCSWYLAMTKF